MQETNNIKVGSFFWDDWKDLCFRTMALEDKKFSYVKMDSGKPYEWNENDMVIEEFKLVKTKDAIAWLLKHC